MSVTGPTPLRVVGPQPHGHLNAGADDQNVTALSSGSMAWCAPCVTAFVLSSRTTLPANNDRSRPTTTAHAPARSNLVAQQAGDPLIWASPSGTSPSQALVMALKYRGGRVGSVCAKDLCSCTHHRVLGAGASREQVREPSGRRESVVPSRADVLYVSSTVRVVGINAVRLYSDRVRHASPRLPNRSVCAALSW